MEFSFPLDSQEEDIYEKNDSNIMLVTVSVSGKLVDSEKCNVYIDLSRDAMIGLGMELIRSAMNGDVDGYYKELYPVEYPLQSFGVFMHPDSCRVFLGFTSKFPETLDELFPEK